MVVIERSTNRFYLGDYDPQTSAISVSGKPGQQVDIKYGKLVGIGYEPISDPSLLEDQSRVVQIMGRRRATVATLHEGKLLLYRFRRGDNTREDLSKLEIEVAKESPEPNEAKPTPLEAPPQPSPAEVPGERIYSGAFSDTYYGEGTKGNWIALPEMFEAKRVGQISIYEGDKAKSREALAQEVRNLGGNYIAVQETKKRTPKSQRRAVIFKLKPEECEILERKGIKSF